MSFDNRTVMITGAAGQLGRAVAAHFAKAGVQSVQFGASARRGSLTVIRLDQGCLSVNRREWSGVSNTAGLSVGTRRSPVASL